MTCIDCATAIDDATAVISADGPLCDRCAVTRQLPTEPSRLDRERRRQAARALMIAGVTVALLGWYATTLHRYGQLVLLAGLAIVLWGWSEYVAARKLEGIL